MIALAHAGPVIFSPPPLLEALVHLNRTEYQSIKWNVMMSGPVLLLH